VSEVRRGEGDVHLIEFDDGVCVSNLTLKC
jgi:hypothetical protein